MKSNTAISRVHGIDQLASIFFSLPEIKDFDKALPNVKRETIDALWAVPRRWDDMVAVPVTDWKHGDGMCEIVCFKPAEPDDMFVVHQRWGVAAGRTVERDQPVIPNVLEWLQRDMKGIVYIT